MKATIFHVLRNGLIPCLRSPVSIRPLSALLVPLLLASCVQNTVPKDVKHPQRAEEPEQQLADYLSTDCEDIWQNQSHDSMSNPLYWLRAMDCAERLAPIQARAEARRWPSDSWRDTFKRGILLANAKISPTERRRYMVKLDAMTTEVPSQVRSLFQVWRDGQASLLALSDERTRYSKLQQSSDNELDTLREQQQRLRGQLSLTTRKLENLTDIERQLSSRKPAGAELPDNTKPAQEAKP
ncbi:two-component system QseEF-associated lipoprotein QseG [Buttiauxella noackiae]|uniref:Putative alpha helix protein n=1 Tax=Buttiauxella noackiae ATCC 51607 TaxID=1354255 RepID=A0A1B7HMU4_9ENTR|nr:two-component system QseEF-associated lipoprotein QseG [Buttiauxella noackiae]MCA1922632.1 two-component system QseEF-associated lipoprotein QseG [Buttiauxella noackiae]OAT16930.1 putative alpha helix protein [Buttiauxella noackiae ATCC 51607]